jgi:hypothetical protein
LVEFIERENSFEEELEEFERKCEERRLKTMNDECERFNGKKIESCTSLVDFCY